MAYHYLDYNSLLTFCHSLFTSYGFTAQESESITDVLLAADLNGIESHGIQRIVRYDHEITTGLVSITAKPEIIFETPLSLVMDAHQCMGQLAAKQAMESAIQKAKLIGCGMVAVRNCNHYGIAGYYAEMAAKEDLLGICMTNTEAIMVPTHGRQPMLGTNPIALAMPADPVCFSFDCATTVVPRGKLEVYAKQEKPVPIGWGVDETGHDSKDAHQILQNIIQKSGGGILPLGGSEELTGGHKGYGLGLICELFTGILSGGLTSDRINRGLTEGTGICQSFIAIDYGMFGDKTVIRREFSDYLARIRASDKAEGQTRIYTHGEKEAEMRLARRQNGIPANEKTMEEIRKIAANRFPLPREL
ncbi:MAG: Ldh family oxidoreductase [Clostridia bacterium]|nr:Ldh family oxidoreductase [Clostridia bacterium]